MINEHEKSISACVSYQPFKKNFFQVQSNNNNNNNTFFYFCCKKINVSRSFTVYNFTVGKRFEKKNFFV